MIRPEHRHIPGCWNAYVEAGHDRAERQRRLNECPEAFRAAVESHVRLVFALRGQSGLRRGMKNLKGPGGAANTDPAITTSTEGECKL